MDYLFNGIFAKLRESTFFETIFSGHLQRLADPAGNYMFKVNNRNARTRYEIKTPEQRLASSGVFIVDFEHISNLVLVFLLLTLNR